ncbi:MAG: DNA polymerase I [Clostridiales Family XIII bacterium]|nr:DNA polymerase I [Clostridiales Family XIII bacterium]
MDDNKRLVIIDGNSLINRAYYAIQRPMITKDGMYTQGVYGFITMLRKILSDYDPGYLAVAFDRKAPTFRHKEYDEYKAGRKKMPLELAMEFDPLKEVLAAMNIDILEIDGFEADDILGTVAKMGEEEGLEPFIITGDRDALQLVTEVTKVIITKKGISEFELWDPEALHEKYGFGAKEFIDLKGLMGDSSDNIPGVPGVGEKTGIKLISEFGSIENLVEHSDEISKEKLRQKIEEYAQQALMSKRLATIVTNVPVEFSLESLKREEPDLEKLVAIYTKLEFNNFLKKLNSGGDEVAAPSKAVPERAQVRGDRESNDGLQKPGGGSRVVAPAAEFAPEAASSVIIRDVPGLAALRTALDGAGADPCSSTDSDSGVAADADVVAFKLFGDNNHRNTPLVYGISVMVNGSHFYIQTDAAPDLLEKTVQTLTEATGIKLIGHDLKPDLYMLFALIGPGLDLPPVAHDSAVAEYIINPSSSNYSLHNLCLAYFGKNVSDEDEFMKGTAQLDMLSDSSASYAEYGQLYCRAALSLKAAQEVVINASALDTVFNDAEAPLVEPLAEMEAEGFPFDQNALTVVGDEIDAGIETLTKEVYAATGEEFNINSPKQLGIVLFEHMKLPFAKKTKSGYATGAEILEKLAPDYPVAGKALEYRTLWKLRSTYIDGLIPLKAADGRIHAHFQQTVAATGRISCTEPNLQNIPVRQDFGRRIRRAFVPGGEDYTLVGADYSQIELRILAHFSDDPALVEDFRQGADIHRRTAARVFGLAEDDVSAQQRSAAKAVNFGIIYGMSSFGLSENLGITPKEADKYIKDYFGQHPMVKEYLDRCVEDAREKGYSETILGRKRVIPEMTASNYMVRQLGERLAMNSPIQGSAADIMKLAMIRVYRALKKSGLDAKVILQVHDELIIRAHKTAADEAAKILKQEMESAYKLSVPLTVDVNRAESWYDLK